MKIEKIVKDILMNDWDPIGVKNNPNAKAEYDEYALRIVGMLYNGSNENKIVEYLNTVVTQDLGLPVNDGVSKMVSKKLVALELERPNRK